MKRKVLSLVIALAVCLNLCPARAFAAGEGAGAAPPSGCYEFTLTEDQSWDTPYVATAPTIFDTDEYTFTGTGASAIRVTNTGELYLKGKIVSDNSSGVEVQSGGSLTITEPGVEIKAGTYALDIASGATVRLSAGTYYGDEGAIHMEGDNFASLLAEGCAFFNRGTDGKDSRPLRPAEVSGLGRWDTLGVGQCTDHLQEGYTPAAGAARHTWTCAYCAEEQSEPCTFAFGENETKACGHACGNTLTVFVDEDALAKLVYDGTVKPEDGAVKVTLQDGAELAEGTDYTAAFVTNKDAGEVTVTVTGVTFNGTFFKTYTVDRNQTPVLTWGDSTKAVDYDGAPVESGDLPPVTIDITSTEDLKGRLQYSYKKAGDSGYTDGLPTNAGTYEVIASLPAMENFAGAETAPLTLTVNKIGPISETPAAKALTFNRAAQELVTPGALKDVAARDGVNILFAASETGPYSTEIPSGTSAGSYDVWYKVEGAENYDPAGPAQINNVKIVPKSITPTITVTEPSYVFDDSKKQPVITVKDVDTVIDASQYTVAWAGNDSQAADSILRDVGKYTATIKNITNGNYTFSATAKVEIVAADQDALTITGTRDPVCYGDVFTLGTTGGTGNGTVAWSVTSGAAAIDAATGKLTVKGIGPVTVKAERTVANHVTVSDTWTFTAQPKPVVAEVTVTPKVYDGTTSANVTAAVKASDLVNGDTFTLDGLTGSYDDANVGTNKAVTLNDTAADKTAGGGKYAVSYPTAVKGDITRRNVTVAVTLSGNGLTQSGGSYSYVYDGQEKTPAVTVTGSDGSYSAALAESDYEVRYSDNLNVGTAAVTVTAKAGGNYTFADKTVSFTIKQAGAVLTSTPQAKDLTYIKGTAQELVTVGTADGGTVVYSETENGSYSASIPKKESADTYTVYYKVEGDANHSDTAPGQVSVTIKPKEFTPVIKLNQTSYVYNGSECKPAVTVKDGSNEIPAAEYTVSYRDNINAGTAMAVVSDNNGGNYIVNGTADFQIEKADAAFTRDPAGKTGLEYTGAAQELVSEGVTSHGAVVYALDGGNYSPAIPTASAVKAYSIQYMIRGDANHKDTAPRTLTVSIGKNTVNNPVISLSSDTFKYTGTQQRPEVTVYDGKSGRVIPEHEYTVTITGVKSDNTPCSNMIDVATYTVEVATPDTSNYVITGNRTKTFAIVPADQETISITGAKGQVYYGDVIQLDATGGTGGGTVAWTISGNTGTTLTSTGLLTVKDVGRSITVTATRSRGDNYSDISATWTFTAAKKPVTAVLTGVDKNYNGDRNATIKAKVSASDLVFGDTVTIPDLSGTFDNANVGTNKTVTKTGSAAATGTNADKYDITYPATTTASILAVPATATSPTAPTLTYIAGTAQALVTAGAGTGGEMVYSLDGTNYSSNIPTGQNAGTYTVYYKVRGDQNHTDSAVGTKTVTINRQPVTPSIELTPPSAQYDGQIHRPAVTARDAAHNVIPAGEYKVTYVTDDGKNWRDTGSYQVKIEDISGGNYAIQGTTASFTISETAQSPLTITGRPGRVQYGDAPFVLSAVGGSGTGTITWSSSNENIAAVNGNGRVSVKKSGTVTITATRAADANYGAVSVDWTFTVEQKPVSDPTVTVTAANLKYTGEAHEPAVTVVVEGNTLGAGEYDVGYSNNTNAGTATVTVTSKSTCNYQFSGTAAFTIGKGQAVYVDEPGGQTGLTYNGGNQALVTSGTANFGAIEYSLNQDSGYSASIPQGTDAGEYTVWYRVTETENYEGIDAASTLAKIEKATPAITNPTASGTEGQKLSEIELTGGAASFNGDPVAGSFAWTNSEDEATAGTEYEVTFTPTDQDNFNTAACQVQAVAASPVPTPSGGAPSADISSVPATNAVSMSMPASVKNGTASAAVTAAAGSKLVKAAAANQSPSVVIKPEIDGSVSKAEVSIPASTVRQIRAETDAALTVSTPIAEATIPQEALDTLGRAGGAVSVAAEQVDEGVALTLTAGGRKVDSVPGGLTLTVPAEDAGPGTVAVLVHEDGSRETVRKSVAGDGKVNVPLSGSATVEIVDNSKAFSDVPPTNWEADAVAFASAHELFSGTGETTFSPEEPMSRGMLATVLYNLEGRPEQDLTRELPDGYSDVSGDAWYAEGVAWATEKGIVNGYGNGEFGPDDSVTREQLAVILWKYAGSPAASGQALSFTDAALASDYAWEALCWAAEKGIMNGCGDGRLAPGRTATRAEAAQMLKNYMERV